MTSTATAGLFAGSFDPPTLGHRDIIVRAAALCTPLWIGIGRNPHKRPMLTIDTRLELLRAECAAGGLAAEQVRVAAFDGATVHFARAQGLRVLIRGLRGSGDLNAERGMAEVNRMNGLDTVFLLAQSAHSHLSSQLVREAAKVGLPLDGLVSDAVAGALRQALDDEGERTPA